MKTRHGNSIRRAALAGALALLAVGTHLPAEARAAKLRFAQNGYTRVPFDVRLGHIWMRGTVNGSDSLWIVVDTGASASVLDLALARRLSLELGGEHRAQGAAGAQTGQLAKDVTIELPGLSIERETTGTVDLASITQQGGRAMDVVLGYELFEHCVVRFDYAAGLMEVWEAKKAPRDIPGVAVPLTFVHNHPYVEAELTVAGRAPIKGRFVIDSGSTQALIVAPDVVARESLATAFDRTLVAIGRGVGGELRNKVGRAEALSIGTLRFERPIVVLAEAQARISAPGTLGNIGGQFLGRCRVTYDYPRRQVRFEPAKDFARPFEADMSGAVLTRVPAGFEVRWVGDDTPAAEAGLAQGDIVTEVDGRPADGWDPVALRLLLQQEGRTVQLVAKREAESRPVTLKLRRLI